MRWVSYSDGGRARAGYVEDGRLFDLGEGPLQAWFARQAEARAAAQDAGPLDEARLLQPVLRPGKILGIGVNYAAHAAESASFVKNAGDGVQKWFVKQATAANAPFADVDLPAVSEQLDYEGELVVVIGKRARHVPEARAMQAVAGFCCGCDYSVRDWQRASQTMIMGKGFDTHAPFGPAIVTPEEAGDWRELKLRTLVNGERRQDARAGEMTFSIEAQIAHLTAAFTLEPGDVIFTGTPAGVGTGFDPPKWLKAGDRVRVEIDGLGAIEQTIVQERAETVIA